MIHIFDADDNSDAEKVLGSGQTSRKMSLAGEWRNQVSISSRMRGAFSGGARMKIRGGGVKVKIRGPGR